MAEDTREITITVRIRRKVGFQFTTLCRANRIKVYQGVEESFRAVLERHGINVDEHSPYAPEDDGPRVGTISRTWT
jgi:hypothetical protein